MGQRLMSLAQSDPDFGAVRGVDIDTAGLEELTGIDVVVDFSVLDRLAHNADVCASRGWSYVSGVTGLTDGHHRLLDAAAAKTGVLWAPNFSVGINTLLALVGTAAKMLGPSFDLELVESHHRMKVDSPSGTARSLAAALADARGWDYDAAVSHRPEGLIGARPDQQIGMAVVRGGSVVGEHSVLYLGSDEEVVITHRASNRDIFVRGALRAAKWLATQPAGRYVMADVLAA